MANEAADIVQKLWNLCNILRDDGITYHQYVSELTYLLFLKMAKETGEEDIVPEKYRWASLLERNGLPQLTHYREALVKLGSEDSPPRLQAIFLNASTTLKEARNLNTLVQEIEKIDWFHGHKEQLGDLYEGLLEKNASEKKSGAGQYFTPRPLIDTIVEVVKPQPGERVQDPAAGTGGFLIAADRYVRRHTKDLRALKSAQQEFQIKEAFYGLELVQDTHRLCLMNLLLHGIEGPVELGDTLSPTGESLPRADVILTNPPFGTKKGGGQPTRQDLPFATSNKQFSFLQHIYRSLKPAPKGSPHGGRAAVVLPDNVLFEENTGAQIRADLMDRADLHTILRLPTGIFYAQGVKTNVLFFSRGAKEEGNTREVWVYDMRANAPAFGKRTPLTREHFADFVACYGDDPHGKSPRKEQGETGRFRRFSRDDIKKRGDNLDISWLKDDSHQDADDLPEPEAIAAEILEKLRAAMEEIEAVQAELERG